MSETGPCSLAGYALEERALAWRALSGAMVGAEPTDTGAALHYRLDHEVTKVLLELMAAERHCCPTLSFEATVTVRVDAPEDKRAWVASTFVPHARAPKASASDDAVNPDRGAIQEAVRAHYAAAAREGDCCGPSEGADAGGIGANVYGRDEHDGLPARALRSSLGCANPVAVAELAAGEIVLDLGSGGGADVLLSARRVGPAGKAYGLDMTDEMLDLARQNQADAGVDNVEFLRGHIEAIPLPDESVDVVLSNCVIGLSPDKGSVFAEAHRVLRPGGRLALADVVADAAATPEHQGNLESWVSCVAGALTRAEYRAGLEAAGFVYVSIEDSHRVAEGLDSVVVRARKPAD